MANQPPNPANNLNMNLPPQSVSSQSSAPYTPRSSSIADDSDTEFDPTPLQSPRGGPEYDDLPPSYDEAQHQAVSDARNGVVPLDPNQIEAHRLTLNEGPNDPEIWEYRIRGEDLDIANEQAPDYSNITTEIGTTVPVQYVESSEDIPVGRTGIRETIPSPAADLTAELTTRALNFTRHEPDADAQYAPRLARRVAIPQQSTHGATHEPIQFSRAYAKALHAHSIRPAEFTEFLDGLNALCVASGATFEDLLSGTPRVNAIPSIVHDYINGANEAFFAPRGLRVSLQSLSALIQRLSIPTERGQQAGAVASALDHTSTVERRAQALHPWIEAIVTDVPAPSTHSLMLREMAERLRTRADSERTTPANNGKTSSRKQENEDPPHSSLEDAHDHSRHAGPDSHPRHGRGRGGHRGGPWTPFGAPGLGPFGAPGNGPFGRPGNGPFGGRGRGPRRGHSRGSHGSPGCGHHGPPGYDRTQAGGSGPSQSGNEWSALGENIGKWGEEFGKRMGDWGQQFGKQASVWGQEVSASASGSSSRYRPGAASAHTDDGLPPSYDEGHSGQQTGVLRGDSKTSHDPPKYEDMSQKSKHSKSEKEDDASSISSDSSDSESDSDSDSDDEDLPDTQAMLLKRIQSINKEAEASAQKGKKTAEEIAEERAVAIEKAQDEKLAADVKIEEKMSKRAMRRDLKQRSKELRREHRQRKRDLKASHGGKGKGKGKAKKSPEWKQAKKEYKAKRKDLRNEKLRARQEWREARSERLRSRRDVRKIDGIQEEKASQMVWIVIENLGT
jgi:hypothetical protein